MTEHFTSEEGIEISIVELEKTFIFTIGDREITLSKEKADALAEVLHKGGCCPILDTEYFYH